MCARLVRTGKVALDGTTRAMFVILCPVRCNVVSMYIARCVFFIRKIPHSPSKKRVASAEKLLIPTGSSKEIIRPWTLCLCTYVYMCVCVSVCLFVCCVKSTRVIVLITRFNDCRPSSRVVYELLLEPQWISVMLSLPSSFFLPLLRWTSVYVTGASFFLSVTFASRPA